MTKSRKRRGENQKYKKGSTQSWIILFQKLNIVLKGESVELGLKLLHVEFYLSTPVTDIMWSYS